MSELVKNITFDPQKLSHNFLFSFTLYTIYITTVFTLYRYRYVEDHIMAISSIINNNYCKHYLIQFDPYFFVQAVADLFKSSYFIKTFSYNSMYQ